MPLPVWERRFPGLQQREVDALHTQATRVQTSLGPGCQWVIDLDWPMDDGSVVHLEATYPDTFPCTRPHVRLLGGKDPRPTRHVAPIDGAICLLGRASNQWHAGLTLADMLKEQLANALNDTGDQDPQGEPADYWWNGLGLKDSYCLVDSNWTLGDASSGTLELRIATGSPTTPLSERKVPPLEVCAAVMAVRCAQGQLLAAWEGPLPKALEAAKTVTVPWARLPETLLPQGDTDGQLLALRSALHLESKPQNLGGGCAVRPFVLTHPIETGLNTCGVGWILVLEWGHPKAFRPRDKGRQPRHTLARSIVPVMRAGSDDLGVRVPTVALLRQKRVAVFGLGAIGSPVAIELARAGCKRLHLIEHDSVEPGNTVRWPLGTSAWGRRKVLAIADFIAREYPMTTVVPHQQMIGGLNDIPDEVMLNEVLGDVDLVIDGTVAWGVTQLLDVSCRERGIPLLQLFATPTLEGGAVVRLAGSGGCLVCLEHAWDQGEIIRPPGALQDQILTQPTGCAERTFTGASYDLEEVSLQTVRLAIQTLADAGTVSSLIQTLSLVNAAGQRMPPQWREESLPRHPKCTCQPQQSS